MTQTASSVSTELEKRQLSLGFIPLTDCAPLVIAREKGYFEKYGLDVQLSKETSWANIRDKVAIGILDGAQMLAPMPLAMTLGVGPVHKPMVTAFNMDLNGNAITVSKKLYQRMHALDPVAMRERPLTAQVLRRVIEANKAAGHAPLTFAMVFPVSTHNYELRYWMASAGIDPDRDVDLVVIPPPQMVGALSRGEIDGYCVGEPWNQMAVQEDLGHTLITSYELWHNRPEKVLGVTQEWAEQNPNTHQALLMALLEASAWMDDAGNRREVCDIIARGIYVNAPAHVVRMPMTGVYQYAADQLPVSLPDFNVFHRYAANFPWQSHAVWFITQMLRWGQLDRAIDIHKAAAGVYRPDLYRQAAEALGMPVPAADYKLEGRHRQGWSLPTATTDIAMGPDAFFDGQLFDPLNPVDYLAQFPVANPTVDITALDAANPVPPSRTPAAQADTQA